jgi:hypothetical protein
MNAFAFAPATRRNTHVLIALAGASGSGKTYSGLELATGLAGDRGRIAVIDTEAGRALHYADRFKFDHCELTPPFTPDRYREAIAAAEHAGYAVIVIDSMSHEHDGEGGLIEMAEQEAQTRRDDNKAAAWAMPKAKHKRMMNRLLQLRAHLIFCLRAEDKIKMVKVFDERKGREVITIEPAGWQPICEKRFMFEMTASFVLTPENPGVPGVLLKLQEQHRPAFPKGQPIGRESGRVIAEWAAGGAAPERREADEFATLNRRAIAAARSGKATFRGFWQELDADERSHLRPMLREFEAMALQAEADEDPFARHQPDYEQDPGDRRQDRPAAGAQLSDPPRGATVSAETGRTEHPGEQDQSSTPTERSSPPPVSQTETIEPALRDEPKSLAVNLIEPAGKPVDYVATKDAMLAVIATKVKTIADVARFRIENRSTFNNWIEAGKANREIGDLWRDVQYHLANRERVLRSGEP